MASTTPTTTNICLLATRHRRPGDQYTQCRFLVDGIHVKYGEVAPDVFEQDWDFRLTKFTKNWPAFPTGDWTYCQIERTLEGLSVVPYPHPYPIGLPSTSLWHHRVVDYSELTTCLNILPGVLFKEDKLWLVEHEDFEGPVLRKMTQFPGSWGEMVRLEAETHAYDLLQGEDITPEFLGHVTAGGGAAGFLMEYMEDARVPDPTHIHDCLDILDKLHRVGIVHGNPVPEKFLLKNGKVYIIDFEEAKFGADATQEKCREDCDKLMTGMLDY